MKFRSLKIGQIEVDIRVLNSFRGIYLAAYEPDHARAHPSGELLHKVKVREDILPSLAFEIALRDLKDWIEANSKSPETHINSQRSRRSRFEQIRHICNYRTA